MHKFLLLLLPFFFLSCSENATTTPAEREIYTRTSVSTSYQPMLVIRVEFNAPYTFKSSSSIWEHKIFGADNSTVNHYYNEISARQFQFQPVNNNTVPSGIATITLNEDHPNFYAGDDINEWTNDIKKRLYPILEKALIKLNSNGFDFSVYDTNSDEIITPNELLITYILAGGEDAYSGGVYGKSGVWAHVDCTTDSYTYDGVKMLGCGSGGNYAVFGERHYDSTTSHDATIGIIAHELGHAAFDLPDLYYGQFTRIGYYGLMANGSWGQADIAGYPGDTPTHMCAWSKIDTSWYSVSQTSDNNNIQVNATGSIDYNIIKVPLNTSKEEYFLIENRGSYGYDTGLNDINSAYVGGLAIWHIDETVIDTKRADNIINSDPAHKGVDLEEAAGPSVDYGNGDPVLNLYYSGNVNTFTPSTSPNTNSYDGVSSLIYFTDISTPSNAMTVSISN